VWLVIDHEKAWVISGCDDGFLRGVVLVLFLPKDEGEMADEESKV